MIEGTDNRTGRVPNSVLPRNHYINNTDTGTNVNKNSSQQLQGTIDAFNPNLPYTFKN